MLHALCLNKAPALSDRREFGGAGTAISGRCCGAGAPLPAMNGSLFNIMQILGRRPFFATEGVFFARGWTFAAAAHTTHWL